jgi:hypothetical protein
MVQPDVWQHMGNLGISPGVDPATLYTQFRVDKAIKFKIFDRMGIWLPALTALRDDPWQLATGRPLAVSLGDTEKLWQAGAHNVFLEWMLNLGLIPGLLMGVFTAGCVIFVMRFGSKFRYDAAAIWTSLAGLSIIPGLMMGQYPIQAVCAALFWLVIGLAMKIDADWIRATRQPPQTAL